ncbi:MAG: energy-coupling factor transporter transmembrane protein EcfT [Clostridia bacterium]|nr:energy-coupling factor transporter transmembrane protein EcfT [Clostridia bacterium]
MFRDITLGQFYPGDSFLHRADPRIKTVSLVLFLVLSLVANNAPAIGAVVLTTALLTVISRIPLSVMAKSLRPIILILIFTGIINVFFTGGQTPLWEWHFLHIYPEGIRTAVFMMIRLVCLVCGCSLLLSFTTSPLALTDALESLLSPLKVFRLPVHEFSMMMTIALRFIPTLMEETDKIISAQKARGADLDSGRLTQKIKALVPILVPLFVSAFRRADELADAMECRCYQGGKGRTKLNVLKTRGSDYLFLFFMIADLAAVIFLNSFVHITLWNIAL